MEFSIFSSQQLKIISEIDANETILKHILVKHMINIFQRIVKRQARVYFLFLYFTFVGNCIWGTEPFSISQIYNVNVNSKDSRSDHVFRAQRVNRPYLHYLNKLILEAEKNGGPYLSPTQFPNIAIKVKTIHAPGHQVSTELLNALLDFLSGR